MPDGHSELEPPLPIPNRTVKRLCADDSELSLVKVGHRQASQKKNPSQKWLGFFFHFPAVEALLYLSTDFFDWSQAPPNVRWMLAETG